MDSEIRAYLETGEDQLEGAILAFGAGRYALCAFLSGSSAESVISALLVALGAKPSRKHKNSLVIRRLIDAGAHPARQRLEELLELMKHLEPHIIMARYPILRGSRLLSPSKFYTKDMGAKALDAAKKVMGISKSLLGREFG